MENDLIQLWRLVAELTDQLAQNRAITASLQAQAGSVKSAASHQGTGFALRRFNMHISQEAFESELERMNATFVQHNMELLNDNKQLAALLKEYEQTLENVMSKFRTHAHAAQQHELSLTRHYESLLLSRETSTLSSDLAASTAYSHSLARMSHLLRAALRACGGELPPDDISDEAKDADLDREQSDYVEGSGIDDWALERESELARLEYENVELRRMLGILPPPSSHPSPHVSVSSPQALPTRWESMSMFEDNSQGGMGLFGSGPTAPIADPTDDLSLRRQPSHPQGQTQISLEPHTEIQPLHVAFAPDAPLVTRKYGRRSGSGSGSFIGGGNGAGGFFSGGNSGGGFMGGGGASENISTGPFGTFRPGSSGGTAWQDSPMAGPGERDMNLPGPGPGPVQDTEDDGLSGDERATLYLRASGAGRRSHSS